MDSSQFKITRPETKLDPDCCEEIEQQILTLVELQKEGQDQEILFIHQQNLADYEDFPDAKIYYVALYVEAFE